jgi:hypothetical protein
VLIAVLIVTSASDVTPWATFLLMLDIRDPTKPDDDLAHEWLKLRKFELVSWGPSVVRPSGARRNRREAMSEVIERW